MQAVSHMSYPSSHTRAPPGLVGPFDRLLAFGLLASGFCIRTQRFIGQHPGASFATPTESGVSRCFVKCDRQTPSLQPGIQPLTPVLSRIVLKCSLGLFLWAPLSVISFLYLWRGSVYLDMPLHSILTQATSSRHMFIKYYNILHDFSSNNATMMCFYSF